MNIISKKNFEIIFYSTFFITSTNLLLLKISPQILFFFGTLPWLIIGLCTKTSITLISYFFSTIFIYFLIKFNLNDIKEDLITFFILNIFLISILSLIITSCLKHREKNRKYMNIGKVFSYYTLTISLLLLLFMEYYYLSIDLDSLSTKIKDLYLSEIKTKDINLYSQIDELMKITFSIFPAINSFLFLMFTIINLYIATRILSRCRIYLIPEIKNDDFKIPNWCLVIITLNLIILYLSTDNLNIMALNFFIVFSAIYFMNGLQILDRKIKKANVNSALKFLLLFLLFTFFSYLLIIFLFFIGIINHIKRIYSKHNVLGE